MSESEIILNLSTYFPGKSESYLKEIYRRCNCDIAATIDAINDEDSGKKNFFNQFFEKLTSLLQFFFTLIKPASEETEDNEKDEDNEEDEQVLQINIGQEFAEALEEEFSDSPTKLPKDFKPIIEIPVSLGRKLFGLYVESILKQEEAEEKDINDLIAQNEDRIKRLNDQKFFFAQDEEVIDEQDGKLETVRLDLRFLEPQMNVSAFKIEENEQPLSFFREQEKVCLRKFKKLEQLANHCFQRGDESGALEFSEKAKEESDLAKEYNHLAVMKKIEENGKGQPEHFIDFHGLKVKESLFALDNVLDERIKFLKANNLKKKTFVFVTGRGKHSEDGIPHIKNAVAARLKKRALWGKEIHRGGCLEVTVYHHSILTKELK